MNRRNLITGLIGLAVAGTLGKVFGCSERTVSVPVEGCEATAIHHAFYSETASKWGNPVLRIWFNGDLVYSKGAD